MPIDGHLPSPGQVVANFSVFAVHPVACTCSVFGTIDYREPIPWCSEALDICRERTANDSAPANVTMIPTLLSLPSSPAHVIEIRPAVRMSRLSTHREEDKEETQD